MSYKNTMKLFASNFMLVWKHLLYLFILLVIFTACVVPISKPVYILLKEGGAGGAIISIFKTAYNSPSELFLHISNVFKQIFSLVFSNFGNIYLSLIGLFFLAFLIPYILIQMSIFNLNSILYQKLSMNMDASYIQNGIKTLKHSFLFAISNILFSLPFFAMYVLLFYIFLKVSTTVLGSILGLVGLAALLIIFQSIKMSIFTCYTGYMVENNCSPFVAFGKGLALVVKNFWKVLSTSIILYLTIVFVIGFISIFTLLSGLIVLIPAAFVLLAIYNLVIYFNIKGERYYLGNNFIFNPIKYTVKQDDSVLNQTNIPEEPTEIRLKTPTVKKKNKKSKTK